eukprot:gnl/TRDRNA2_/TRDRNA2_184970_c0_seq1.p1 gnl/TRDRNA2_/TRDRNA2_184970_c0~~gnl/TRDRNA2_/TRDRNA2_184970_c0_seq1.p1  ORF type:complete len:138 (+),score=35.15 gnl/TRDRNA2_/TRDRNA2_184970_c0_seq1:60-416(+)
MAGALSEEPSAAPPAVAAEAEKELSIWELLDELIGVDRRSLAKVIAAALGVLLLIAVAAIAREVSKGNYHLALLHGGFVLLVLGLAASVAFVIHEASRLESNQDAQATDPGEDSKKTK